MSRPEQRRRANASGPHPPSRRYRGEFAGGNRTRQPAALMGRMLKGRVE